LWLPTAHQSFLFAGSRRWKLKEIQTPGKT
jgi:hypothetical protein